MTDTAVRRSRYPIDTRAERILSAAFAEFNRQGVRDARLSSIARHAGVSLATLRQYFPDKDELYREVIRSTLIRTIQRQPASDPLPTGRPVTEQVREFAREFWRAMREPDRGALLRLSISELHQFPELALFHSTEVIGRAVQRLESMLEEAARRGEIRLPDTRTAARVIHAALLTYALWFASPAVYGDLTGRDRDRAEEAVLDVLVWTLGGGASMNGKPG
jgi:TetR/AcrR family transcriptional regulator